MPGMSESTRSLGLFVSSPLVIDARPVPVLVLEWSWQNPLRAILAISGFSIDQVVSSRRVAAAVRLHWRIHNMVERLRGARHRAAELQIELDDLAAQIAWRRDGLPVPCVWCRSLAPCACDPPTATGLALAEHHGNGGKFIPSPPEF